MNKLINEMRFFHKNLKVQGNKLVLYFPYSVFQLLCVKVIWSLITPCRHVIVHAVHCLLLTRPVTYQMTQWRAADAHLAPTSTHHTHHPCAALLTNATATTQVDQSPQGLWILMDAIGMLCFSITLSHCR